VGGMLLGWIAGTMAVTDPALVGHVPADAAGAATAALRYGAGVAGALFVLALGLAFKRRAQAAP